MITILSHKKKRNTQGLGWMCNGTTFTGTITFKKPDGQETTTTGLFLVTSDKAAMGDLYWVVVVLHSKDNAATQVIREQIFDIQVENCQLVDLNIEVVDRKD